MKNREKWSLSGFTAKRGGGEKAGGGTFLFRVFGATEEGFNGSLKKGEGHH